MCQHIVHLPRQAGPLVQRRGPDDSITSGDDFLQELLGRCCSDRRPAHRGRSQIGEEESGHNDTTASDDRGCALIALATRKPHRSGRRDASHGA